MSLYNALFGMNKDSGILLYMAGLTIDQIPRFRDCYFDKDKRQVILYTRTGGGNRESYKAENDRLVALPNYVNDYDDDFDSTYAYFIFNPLKESEEVIEKIFGGDYQLVGERFVNLVKKLRDGVKDEETKRALHFGEDIVSKLDASLKKE